MSAVKQRSTFVTVVAWIFIVLSGFGTLIGILQNIMVQTVFRSGEFGEAMQAVPPDPGLPPVATFMFEHFHWIFLAVLLVNLFMLASAIGLLKRRNWARRCFIAIMILGVVWQVVGLIMQATMFSFMRDQFSAAQMQGAPDMGPFFIAMGVVSVIFALAFGGLFGWIAWKLASKPIAMEFGRA
jgi:hypothetical protein